MSFFKRKQKSTLSPQQEQDKKDAESKAINKAMYKVHIYEKLGSTPRLIKTLNAYRWIDEDELIPYLRNNDEKFLEVYPQQVNDVLNYSRDEIISKLKKVRDKLKEEKQKAIPSVNFKDLEFDIMKYESQLRALNYPKDFSYVSLGDNNQPEFHCLREGSTVHFFKWDTETKTIYTPSDNKKKSATIALRNKESKYPSADRQIKLATLLFLVLSIVAFMGTTYIGYKFFLAYDESEIIKLQENMLTTNAALVAQTNRQAQTLTDLTEKFKGQLAPDEVTVVESRTGTRTFNQTNP